MIHTTKEYEKFIFRKDNRAKICYLHVENLKKLIKQKNLLDKRPIIVNKDMEVLDGQHRLLAAKELEVEVHYTVLEENDILDLIALNTSKNWKNIDYLNFFCFHKYQEYIKLKEFIEKNNLTLKIGINLAMGISKHGLKDFKSGNFVFGNSLVGLDIYKCNETVNRIKLLKGSFQWLTSTRFWNPLLRLIKHPEFDFDKWIKNIELFVDRITQKATETGYLVMFEDIYNYRNTNKIKLIDPLAD